MLGVRGHAGSRAIASRAYTKRVQYQEEGRELARTLCKNPVFVGGCMLYWAEGAKRRNSVEFTNSDANMMCMFKEFLVDLMGVDTGSMSVYINCYDTAHSVNAIETYWLSLLGLPVTALRKTQINKLPVSSTGSKKNRLEYGVCRLVVHSTEVLHKLYGAIQEIGKFDCPIWIYAPVE